MENLENIIEAILFVSGDGLEKSEIAEKLQVKEKEVSDAVESLKEKHAKTGIQVLTYKNKVQLCSNPDYSAYIDEVLKPIKEKQLTKAVMEVAAIIAYKQPITRLEIENVRGVNSDYAVSFLVENNLIEVVGRKDAIGKPFMYGTTDNFLKKFGLQNIGELPDYDELLEKIKVIEEPQEKSLMHFEDYSEIQGEDSEQKIEDPKTNKEKPEEKRKTVLDNIVSEDQNGDIEFSQDYIRSLFSKGKKTNPVDDPHTIGVEVEEGKEFVEEEKAVKKLINEVYELDNKDDEDLG